MLDKKYNHLNVEKNKYIINKNNLENNIKKIEYTHKISFIIPENSVEFKKALTLIDVKTKKEIDLKKANSKAKSFWSEFKDFNPFDLKRSAGVGVRVYLPMFGLLGIDWAYGFDLDQTGRRGGSQFHFILGQEF